MKRVAIWLALLVVFAATVLLALPWFLSREVVKERVAAQLSTLTGKQVSLRGESSVSLWPFLQVSYDDVTIGGELALADLPPLVKMDGLEAQLSFASAFWGDVSLSQVRLVRPRFTLRVNSEGTDNWTIRDGPVAERLRLARDAKPETLRIGAVQIVDGIVDYGNAQLDASAELTSLNGTFVWPDITGPASATISVVWRGEIVRLNASADVPFELLRGNPSDLTIGIVSKPANLSYTGTMSLGEKVNAAGKMTAIFPSPRRLLDWIGQPIPAAAVVAETFVEGNFSAMDDAVEFQEASVRIGEHQGTGRLQLQRGEKGPIVSGTLAFETLWLPNPAGLAQQDEGTSPTGKLDFSFLEGFGLDLRLSANAATLEPFEITNMAATAIVRDGGASFEIGDAEALGGNMAGSISISRGKGIELFETDLSLSTVNLERLTTLYGAGGLALEGSGDARFRFRSTGTSARGLLINLEGDGSIDGKSGAVVGFNLEQVPLDGEGNAQAPFSGSTSYDDLALRFLITNGSAFFDGSTMKSGPLEVNLGGQVDLLRRSLALRGEITQEEETKTTPLPFFVGGSTAAPLFVVLPTRRPPAEPTE